VALPAARARRGVRARAEASSTAQPPPAVYNALVGASKAKAGFSSGKTAVLGFAAGCLIGIGALLMTVVGGGSPALASSNPGLSAFLKGAVGLPGGLTLVVLTGAELFTGNVMVMMSGFLSGAIEAGDLVKNWVASYLGNFAGSVFLAWMAVQAKTVASGGGAAVGIAVAKCSIPFSVAVAKGVLCNWLVCLAVWSAIASNSVAGKILGIFLPISCFVALGFEHSIANMFLIPHGMFNGAAVSWGEMMMNNIVPVTLGNILGAAVFVAGIYWYAYGRD
jgi:formate/nitrite transporter